MSGGGAGARQRFELFITTDQNLRYQQDLTNRRLAIHVLPTTNWLEIERNAQIVVDAVNQMTPGECREEVTTPPVPPSP